MRRFHFLASLAVILLDQLTKWMVDRSITLHDSIVLIPGFLKLTNAKIKARHSACSPIRPRSGAGRR